MLNYLCSKISWAKCDRFLGFILMAGVFILIFTMSHSSLCDADIWLHLKTGELIAQNKIIPRQDIFSFTAAGRPWIDHSWLFQLFSYFIYSRWQADGLIFLQSTIITLAFGFLFLMGYRIIRSYLEPAMFILFAAYACISRFNIRPEIFSLFFFSLYLFFLSFYLKRWQVWLLVPIQVFWVNLHGYFFLGPLTIILFILAEFFRRRRKFLPWQWQQGYALSDTAYLRLKKLLLLTLIACLINPNGLRGAFYPFFIAKEALLGRTDIFREYIKELQPTFGTLNYLINNASLYLIVVILCFGLMLLNIKRLSLREIFLGLFFFLFSFTLRHIAFFVFIGYLIIVSYIVGTINNISRRFKLKNSSDQAAYYLFKCTLVIITIAIIGVRFQELLSQQYYDFKEGKFKSELVGISANSYPKGAADFILQNDIRGNIFNDFNSGAYLIGRAYPQIKVFIDGRTELYGPDFFKEYLAIIDGDSRTFIRLMSEYPFRAIFFRLDSRPLPPLLTYIYQDPQWRLVFCDAMGIIFLKDIPANQGLITKFNIDLNKYAVPQTDLVKLKAKKVYPSGYLNRAYLFNLLGKDRLAILECRQALRIMPDCAEAHYLMAKIHLDKQLYRQAYVDLRSVIFYQPDNVEALVDSGACLMELKQNQAAISTLKRALRLNKNYTAAYYYLGRAYFALNKKKEAISAFNRAFELSNLAGDKELAGEIKKKLVEIKATP